MGIEPLYHPDRGAEDGWRVFSEDAPEEEIPESMGLSGGRQGKMRVPMEGKVGMSISRDWYS